MTSSPCSPRGTPAQARQLDANILWLVGRHPTTARELVHLQWFDRNRSAGKCLRRLARCGKVSIVGTVSRGLGRPEQVFCGWRPEPSRLIDEVRLTEVFLRLDAAEINRGPFVTDQTLRPTAELWIKGVRYPLELDRGEVSVSQFAGRFLAYTNCNLPSLWLCATEERTEELRRNSGTLRGRARFAALTDALRDPHAEIWRDFDGARMGLPHEKWPPSEGSGS